MTKDEHRNGFISLHRSILKWEWYGDANTSRLFIHLLLTAEFEDTLWRGREVKRGQRICSVSTLSSETGLTVQEVRTALSHLEMTNELTNEKTPQGTAITIKNYDKFQRVTNQTTNKRQTKMIDKHNNKPIDKENNKRKESGDGCAATGLGVGIQPIDKHNNKPIDKENNKPSLYIININKPPISPKGKSGVFEDYAGEDSALLEALRAFEEMRNKIKKPMTDVAKKRLTQKLDKLAKDYPDKVDLLGEAVLHCWQSVYPPKEGREKNEEDDSDVL